MRGGSGYVVEWRTGLGLVVARERVWSEADARQYVRDYALAFPAMAPWLVGPMGAARPMGASLRPWDLSSHQVLQIEEVTKAPARVAA